MKVDVRAPTRREQEWRAYMDEMGEESLRREVIARERTRGCVCSDEEIVKRRLRNHHRAHRRDCAMAEEDLY